MGSSTKGYPEVVIEGMAVTADHGGESDPATPERRLSRRGFLALGAAVLGAGTYGVLSNGLRREDTSLGGGERWCRVALIADVHAPHYWVDWGEVTSLVNSAECDLVAIVGDTIGQRGDEHLVEEHFRELTAKVAKVACLGNWEHWGGVDLNALRRRFSTAGVDLLVNEALELEVGGHRVSVVGLDDLLGVGFPRYNLLEEVRGAAIVLSHCPETVVEIAARRPHRAPTLVLSGHTHGGQIAPFGIPVYTPPGSGDFVRGAYRVGSSDLVVSPGIGHTVLPLRLGVNPTVVFVQIGSEWGQERRT